ATANALPDPIPDAVKEERRARFMHVQEKISERRLKRKIGKTLAVLVDEVKRDRAIARSSADAPEIDGQVFILHPRGLKPGDFATVQVTRAGAHDLWATLA
ncbi:MAG TPA: TRAM domain-containing protein, partial [Burkholderiales bacterium]|nr:TRAM domain-containing protein [Burkholderiales bacterium]